MIDVMKPEDVRIRVSLVASVASAKSARNDITKVIRRREAMAPVATESEGCRVECIRCSMYETLAAIVAVGFSCLVRA